MYCPTCHQRLSHHAGKCTQCSTDVGHVAGRLYIGRQFIFVDADETHPVALRVDDAVQTYRGRAILSRHVHAIGFGDLGAQDVGLMAGEYWTPAVGCPARPVRPGPVPAPAHRGRDRPEDLQAGR